MGYQEAAAERMKMERAKKAEKIHQAQAAKELAEMKAKDEQIATETMQRYASQTMNPELEKKLQNAKREYMGALMEEKKAKSVPDADTRKEFGLNDETTWGPPKPKADAKAKGSG